jgi:hypothetical protein
MLYHSFYGLSGFGIEGNRKLPLLKLEWMAEKSDPYTTSALAA